MIHQVLRSIEHIPAVPAIILKVTEILKNEDYSVNELTEWIKYDQAIAADVLKMSNSAYLASRHRIGTIRDAVVYLGQKNLIKVVQTAGISKFFNKTGRVYVTSATELWEHSVAVALMSQILARMILKREDERLYLAALLHDIGKIVLGEYVYESYEKIMDMVATGGCSFLDAEEAVIGVNHAELGGMIAARWNYPQDIENTLTYHHRPDLSEQGDNTQVWLVCLADQICMLAGFAGGTDGLAYRGMSDMMNKFAFNEKDLEWSMMQLVEDLERARDLVAVVEG